MKITVQRPTVIDIKLLYIDAYVRYPEDSMLNINENWIDDNNHEMPFLVNNHWNIVIDIDSGKVLNWPNNTEAKISYKVRDEFNCKVIDNQGEIQIDYDGYVPSFMSIDDIGYGDYIYITIDANGFIKNWNFSEEDATSMLTNY